MEYYAHISNSGTRELLIDHLNFVADFAQENGQSFHSGGICRQLGLLHDIGKCSQKFQDVLNGKEKHQDHAVVAGFLYADIMKQAKTLPCTLLCFADLVMAAHHSCLYCDLSKTNQQSNIMTAFNPGFYIRDGMLPAETLAKKYKGDVRTTTVYDTEGYDIVKKFMEDNHLLIDISSDDYIEDFANGQYSLDAAMLYVRMLYSALVDADYCATDMFVNSRLKSDFDKILISTDMMEMFDKYYKNLTANSKVSGLNTLRKKIYDMCSEKGKIVDTGLFTLTAPTGTGKTLSLMKFALENAITNNKERIIVVLPYLSIIEQNAKVYQDIFGKENVLIDCSNTQLDESSRLMSERWNAPIIVTTSVKFFELLFKSRAVDVRRLHNVANSVVVFDECQTLPSSLLNTTFGALKSLTQYFNTTVLLSTATKPAYEHRGIKDVDGEIIDNVDDVFNSYDNMKKFSVTYHHNQKLSCDDLIDYFYEKKKDNQVLYVFNVVRHAKEMYDTLVGRYNPDDCYLLTSRFTSIDKKMLIQEINDKLKAGKSVYLAATQCIEAGVDFDFESGAREIAPFDSIVQTAGRVCRNCDKDGEFLIFEYENTTSIRDYPSADYKSACDSTSSTIGLYEHPELYDADFLNRYFRKLYQYSANYRKDKKALLDAIADMNFVEVDKQYKLIENNACMVVVRPLDKTMHSEYDRIMSRIVSNGYVVTKKDLKDLQPFSISVYGIVSFCVSPLYVWEGHGSSRKQSQIAWYVVDDSCYSREGFDLKKTMIAGFEDI